MNVGLIEAGRRSAVIGVFRQYPAVVEHSCQKELERSSITRCEEQIGK